MWIDVRDRLPEDFGYVLICMFEVVTFVGRYNHGKKHWCTGTSKKETFLVTHWQPLPAPFKPNQ